jgi:outer membrane biosynthesis protein TonB
MNHSFESLEELLHTVRKTGNPSVDDRSAVRRRLSALFAATAVTTSTAVVSAATKATLLSSFLWPFVTGALVGGAVIGTTAVAYRSNIFVDSAPARTETAGAARPPAAPRAEPPATPGELTPPGELPSATPVPQKEEPAPVPRLPEARSFAPPPPKPEPAPVPVTAVSKPAPAERQSPQSLEAESRALAEAQRALRDHDTEWALGMLTQQDRTFAGGVLVEERAAARVFALCAAKRLEEGRAAAERFQKNYPGSLLTERVRQACEP